jgi:hypothetical protein
VTPSRDAARRGLQALFERMADEHGGTVTLDRWYPDGSARVSFTGDHPDSTVRIRYVLEGHGVPLVRVSPVPARGGPDVYVSPVPSAVIAVATR